MSPADPDAGTRVLAASSAEVTIAIGERLGRAARAGDVIALHGDLGSGKTTLVRGLHAGLCAGGRVRSPSFTTLHVYAGTPPLHHFDLYRYEAAGPGFLEEFEAWLPGDGVCAIEWADRLGPHLPRERLDVRLESGEVEVDARRVRLRPHGGGWIERIAGLAP